MLDKKAYEAIESVSTDIEKLITKIERVDGVLNDIDSTLDRYVWELVQAWAELDLYVSDAVSAHDVLE
jgi:hypothetical protein